MQPRGATPLSLAPTFPLSINSTENKKIPV